MKKIILLLGIFVFIQSAEAQLLKKLTDKAKQKADEKVDKKIDDAMNGKKDEKTNTETKEETNTTSSQPATLKSYSKYDFVPGEKIIVFEDFMQDKVGDLPAKWNTNSACETVKIEGQPGQWMKMTKPGVFMPDF